MAIVRRALPQTAPDLEVTIEGVAQLFTEPKLEAMREAGSLDLLLAQLKLEEFPKTAR